MSHPLAARIRPVGHTANLRISLTDPWRGVTEATVKDTLRKHFERCAAALKAMREVGDLDRAADYEALILDAGGMGVPLTLADAIYAAESADHDEQGPENEVRHALETGQEPDPAQIEAMIRASARESYRASELRRAARAYLEMRRAK